jgi:hypothetical protein
MLYSLDSLSCELYVSFGFDRSSDGFIGILSDRTIILLHLKCKADPIVFVALVVALDPN